MTWMRFARRAILACLLLPVCPLSGLTQELANPADARGGAPAAAARADSLASSNASRIVWEMPTVIVTGARISRLREEGRIGTYGQPRWTAHRRFTSTRVYVVPEGYFEFEYWATPVIDRSGLARTTVQYECEMGLPHRIQVDLYSVSEKQGKAGHQSISEQKAEVRWALANWGIIPANPTLYLEWIGVDSAPDHLEGKVLLGGEAATGWHWGVNFVLEHEMGGAMENSNELTAGVSHTLSDGVLAVGAETKLAFIDDWSHRGDYTHEFSSGPSIQWKPTRRAHLDIVPLFGWSDAAARAQITLVLGWEF